MRLPFSHPALTDLSAFVSGELPATSHQSLARHLQQCPRCQASLRFVHRVNAPAVSPAAPAGDALWQRIDASRSRGERAILPAAPLQYEAPADTIGVTSQHRSVSRRWLGVAAAVLAVVAIGRILMPTEAMASGDEGTLTFTPAAPQPGATVNARYVPAPNQFVGLNRLRLRARLRRAIDESYTVPASQLRVLAPLTRASDGAYIGTFRVPDSVVFAVMAVESDDSARVDDNSGRGWEMLVAAPSGAPLFDALFQRSEDMMGRSWEQGYDAIVRATTLYPDSLVGWTHRVFFEQWLFSGSVGDSIRAARRTTIDSLKAVARARPSLSYKLLGSVYFRAYADAHNPGANAADSSEWRYWWQRMTSEYPRHEQAAQRHAVWMNVKAMGPKAALDSLERLYEFFRPLHGPANNILGVALNAASMLGEPTPLRQWTERAARQTPDSALRVAVFLAGTPAYRDEGMHALRALLRDTTLRGMVTRPLGRNAAMQWRSVRDQRQKVFAALGKALVVKGETRAALDTLRLAAEGGWDPALYRDMARTFAQAGDTAGAMAMNARLVVDGRTSSSQRDSLVRLGERALGAAAWSRSVDRARQEMFARLLERSISRVVSPAARVVTRSGATQSLKDLTGGKAGLVIFWSRNCGAALEAVPEIKQLIARLTTRGTPVAFVTDDAPSSEFDAVLTSLGITWPVHYDPRASLADAMRNFGTPAFYVVDRGGRIRFTSVEQIGDVYSRLEAVEAEQAAMRD